MQLIWLVVLRQARLFVCLCAFVIVEMIRTFAVGRRCHRQPSRGARNQQKKNDFCLSIGANENASQQNIRSGRDLSAKKNGFPSGR